MTRLVITIGTSLECNFVNTFITIRVATLMLIELLFFEWVGAFLTFKCVNHKY